MEERIPLLLKILLVMKKLFVFLFLTFCMFSQMTAQGGYAFQQLSHWDDNSLPISSPNNLKLQYSGCWGIAVNGHEYAVVGGAEHVLFFDITNPTAPELVGKFQGTANTVWREFKSYKNRIYAVSDGTTEGLMIFDMSHAEDTIVRSYWSNAIFEKAHTITLDTTSGRIYLNGGSANEGIMVLDVSQNPDQPTFITHASFQGGGLHDSYVRNDTIYASSGYDGYYIYDMTNPLAPNLLAQINTGGYNHNSWLNAAGTHAYYTEEIPAGKPVRIIDLQLLSLGEIEEVGGFLDKFSIDNGDKTAIPHNVYIKDNILFNSQYEDGLLAYDISNPTQPVLLAQYDTHPENAVYNGYFGNWGNYPWLPSGNIITCDMQNGLYILSLNPSVKTQEPTEALAVQVQPNPVQDQLTIQVPQQGLRWFLTNPAGQCLLFGQINQSEETTVSLKQVPAGLYFLHVQSATGREVVKKVVKE
ncbi:MAG TPA: hypothetical protein DCF33_09825 [Saprospirales bacterium]|nr:hypothetical protein [Saprospirales bacterium]